LKERGAIKDFHLYTTRLKVWGVLKEISSAQQSGINLIKNTVKTVKHFIWKLVFATESNILKHNCDSFSHNFEFISRNSDFI